MAKIKYLGLSDVRRLDKGENFGGRLADALSAAVEWNGENNHLIDSDEVGLSPEALELLLDERDAQGRAEFKDVSDLKTIPTSLNEQTFKGLGVRSANLVEDDGAAVQTSGTTAGAPAAPVGGSTARTGSRVATGAGGSGGATVGGSTSGNG